jgi:hypothetical protein
MRRNFSVRRADEITASERGRLCVKCGEDNWWASKTKRYWRCRTCQKARDVVWYQTLDPAFALWRGARSRAKRKRCRFTITVEDVSSVWPRDGRCPVLGMKLVRRSVKGAGPASPSLDRLDNKRGYEKGNIAVISHAANTVKGNHSAEEIMKVARWMKSKSL